MRIPLLLFLTLLSPVLLAHFSFGQEQARILEKILQLRLKEAEVLVGQGEKKDPANKIWLQLGNYIDFLKCTIGEDRIFFADAERRAKLRLKSYKEDPELSSPWKLHCQAETELQWAFARLKFNEQLTAAKEVSRAYKLLEENLKKYPDFLPSLKSFGLLQCLIGSVPDKYKWIPEWKGMKGSVTEGRKELVEVMKAAADDPLLNWLEDEAMFYLSFISMNLFPDEEFGKELILKLKSKASMSPLNLYAASSLLIRSGRSREALELLSTIPQHEEAYNIKYLDYLHGMCLLYKGDSTARVYFRKYISSFKGHTFLRSAAHKLAWSYLLQGDSPAYVHALSAIPAMGSSFVDEDKQAMAELEAGKSPHPLLLKSRLLFDGGYYEDALKSISPLVPSRDLKDPIQRIEAVYRLGRIQEKLGDFKAAEAAYELVLRMSKLSEKEYYAPNAALLLGGIAESRNEKEKAIRYYKLCLSWPSHQYKQSLDQKAQAGLSRLK